MNGKNGNWEICLEELRKALESRISGTQLGLEMCACRMKPSKNHAEKTCSGYGLTQVGIRFTYIPGRTAHLIMAQRHLKLVE
jgi:hypothetical protein